MRKPKFLLILLSLMLAVSMAACGGGGEEAPAAEAPTEAAVEAAPATEAPAAAATEATEEVASETAPAEAAAFDLSSALDEFAGNIPEGWMATGKIDDVKAAIENGAYVVDVREPSEYEAGHIPGAVNLPIRTVAQNLDKIPSDQPVLVYCASGHRAGMATAALRELGYDNVKAFPGGWKAWSDAGEEASTEAAEAGKLHIARSCTRTARSS